MSQYQLAQSLSTAVVGDMVVICGRYGHRLGTITKANKMTLQIDNDLYWRKNGERYGASSRYNMGRPNIRPAKGEDEVTRILAAQATAEAEKKAKQENERAAQRGRVTGYLLATEDALYAYQPSDQEDNGPLTRHMSSLRYMVRSLGESIRQDERQLKSDAEYLRRAAAELDEAIARGATWGVSGYSSVTEHREHLTNYKQHLEQASATIELVASFLGIETKVMLAPMAAFVEQKNAAELCDGPVLNAARITNEELTLTAKTKAQ